MRATIALPYNKFGVIYTPRGLVVANPPVPGSPIPPEEAITLAARLVRCCETKFYEFRNMSLCANDFQVRAVDVRDINGVWAIEVLRPPQPGGPITRQQGLTFAFWLAHYAERKREVDIVLAWLEKNERN